MYVVEEGRLRNFHTEDGVERNLAYLRKGDVFGERVAVPRRAARGLGRGDRRLHTASLSSPSSSSRCSPTTPSFAAGSRNASSSTTTGGSRGCRSTSPTRSCPPRSRPRSSTRRRRWRPSRSRSKSSAPPPEAKPPRAGRRFPHVFQLDEMDCGAACLAMVCRFYGRAVPVSYIREIAHTSTRGTTLNGITRAAEALGFERPLDPRVEEPARRAAAAGDRPLAGRALGRPLPPRAKPRARRRPRERPAPLHPRPVPRVVDRLRLGDRLRRGAGADAGAAGEPRLDQAVPAAVPEAARRSRRCSPPSPPVSSSCCRS